MSGTPGIEDSLREATREARAALKDLKRERQEVERIIRTASDQAEQRIEKFVKDSLEELGTQTKRAMEKSVDKVQAEFDKLANLFLTGDAKGRGEYLGDLLEAKREREGS